MPEFDKKTRVVDVAQGHGQARSPVLPSPAAIRGAENRGSHPAGGAPRRALHPPHPRRTRGEGGASGRKQGSSAHPLVFRLGPNPPPGRRAEASVWPAPGARPAAPARPRTAPRDGGAGPRPWGLRRKRPVARARVRFPRPLGRRSAPGCPGPARTGGDADPAANAPLPSRFWKTSGKSPATRAPGARLAQSARSAEPGPPTDRGARARLRPPAPRPPPAPRGPSAPRTHAPRRARGARSVAGPGRRMVPGWSGRRGAARLGRAEASERGQGLGEAAPRRDSATRGLATRAETPSPQPPARPSPSEGTATGAEQGSSLPPPSRRGR